MELHGPTTGGHPGPYGLEISDVTSNTKSRTTLPQSPSPSPLITPMFTHELDEIAMTSPQEKQPTSKLNVGFESEAKKENGFLTEVVEASEKFGATRSSNAETVSVKESQSDPFDECAVLNSLVKDDFEDRAITFRSIVIGLLTAALGAFIAEVFMFKPVKINVDILFLQIICFVLGRTFAAIPGPKWWNPGPIAVKETVFSLIMAGSASAGVYGVEVIASQEIMFNKRMPLIVSIMTLLSSQSIGYGMAGAILPVVALFHSMSVQSETTKNQMSFFKKTIAAISLYEVFPTYIAPAFSAVSIWCLALPKIPPITNLFGGSLPGEGMGLMAFSADWTLVGSHSPLYVPLMAQITDWVAYFFCIVIFSWAYTADLFGGGKLPFISYNLIDKNGKHYNYTSAVNKDGTRNELSFEELGLPSFSTTFILGKAFLSMAATASITIGICYSIMTWVQNKKDVKLHGKVSKPCPHREITKKMRDFPTYGFIAIFLGAVALAFLSAHLAQSGLTPLALLVALIVSCVQCLASGYFTGTLGIHLIVTPAVQAIGGIIFPGNAIGIMWFNMYGSNSVTQCVLMLKDLKLGTYMHLAPFSVVIAQLIGTVVGCFVHILVMISIVRSQHDVLLMPHGNGIFTGMYLSIMTSSAISWGLFSRELFFPGKIYSIVIYFLCAGFFVPIPFLIFKWFHPKSVFAHFNVSLFIANLSHGLIGANSGRFTAVFVGLMSQFYVRKYRFRWYKKYNYILCAALDGGTQMTVVLLAFILQGGAGFQVKFPRYFLNPDGPRDYCVLPKQEH